MHLEILDFGFPQNSEIDALKMYITTESVKSELAVVRLYSPITFALYSLYVLLLERGFFEDHLSSDRERKLAEDWRQISQKRSFCGCC
jgi:hypothetical protein